MAILCGMPTIQYSARNARLSVRLSKSACPKMTSGQSNLIWGMPLSLGKAGSPSNTMWPQRHTTCHLDPSRRLATLDVG